VIEQRPGNSRGARLLGPLMYRTLRQLANWVRLTPRLLRLTYLVDYLGVLLPAPRGSRVRKVAFADFRAELVAGPGVRGSDSTVLYFHGGGFFSCGLRSHRRLVARISRAARVPVLSVAYRQLPEVHLAVTVQDCLAAYRLLLSRGYQGPPGGLRGRLGRRLPHLRGRAAGDRRGPAGAGRHRRALAVRATGRGAGNAAAA
jgi:hypothetical protein